MSSSSGFSSATVLSLPPATRALTLLLITCSTLLFLTRVTQAPRDVKQALGASDGMVDWLVVTPGNVMWYPWTLLTSSFVENNLIEFLFSLLTLPLAGRYLERVWGQLEFLKFVAVVVVASNIVACVVSYIEAVVLGNPALFLYGMSYHGLMALQTGFLVAFTQLIPEHQVQMLGGLFKMRVKSLPMLYVTVSNVACLLGYQSPWILIQFGWLISWFYLRFIKINEGGEFRGDRSETFSFAAWFPPFAQKYVSQLTNFVFNLAVRFKILTPWPDLESGSTVGYTAVPGGARAEAERRRALALKALDQRMASKPSPNPQSSGSGFAAGPSTSTTASPAGAPAVPATAATTHASPSTTQSSSTTSRQGSVVAVDSSANTQPTSAEQSTMQ
ncbi:hypothetical protein OIV83_005110 [Microbotryomycetes sp. JL201]|nr:hypothetical protein OIV83_005110 [Microbotryomycetes sp. JL201]